MVVQELHQFSVATGERRHLLNNVEHLGLFLLRLFVNHNFLSLQHFTFCFIITFHVEGTDGGVGLREVVLRLDFVFGLHLVVLLDFRRGELHRALHLLDDFLLNFHLDGFLALYLGFLLLSQLRQLDVGLDGRILLHGVLDSQVGVCDCKDEGNTNHHPDESLDVTLTCVATENVCAVLFVLTFKYEVGPVVVNKIYFCHSLFPFFNCH